MLILVLVVVAPIVALTLARRSASHPAVLFVRDLCVSAFLIGRTLFRLGRLIVRFIAGEVRSWRVSRSASRA